MEVSGGRIAITIGLIGIITLVWKVLNWVWLRPKKLEKCLRQQGFKGNSYSFLYGDLNQNIKMIQQAKSKPISFCHDIAPRVVPSLHRSVKDYGKNSIIWFGPVPRVNIMNPEDFKDIFSKPFDFQRPNLHPITRLLADGLANHEGDKWIKHRKIINPALHVQKLRHMVPAFHLCCNEMVSKWEEELAISKDGSCEIDVWPYLENMTADAISRTAFGSSYEEGRKIFQLQREQAKLVIKSIQSIAIPGKMQVQYLPTKLNKRMKEIDREVQASLKDIINKREKAMNMGEAPNDDLLSILMESNFKEIQEHGNNKDVGMSIKDVIEECKLFYFAGQETTSVLLVWTVVLLSKSQEWQERAREEVLQVFGDRKPDFDGLSQLKVVNMILNEILRLYPPVVILTRIVHKPTQLGKLTIPPGVELCIPTVLVHHDQQIWGEDAKEFKPERFAEGVSKATKGQVSFFPFGWGPRICIGQNFALAEAKVALSLILQRFKFELSPTYAHAPISVITLQPQHGAQVILHKR